MVIPNDSLEIFYFYQISDDISLSFQIQWLCSDEVFITSRIDSSVQNISLAGITWYIHWWTPFKVWILKVTMFYKCVYYGCYFCCVCYQADVYCWLNLSPGDDIYCVCVSMLHIFEQFYSLISLIFAFYK